MSKIISLYRTTFQFSHISNHLKSPNDTYFFHVLNNFSKGEKINPHMQIERRKQRKKELKGRVDRKRVK